MKHSPYPYAPLMPVSVVTTLELAAIDLGIELSTSRGQRTPKSEKLADRVTALSDRLRADALEAEQQMHSRALGRLFRARPTVVPA